MRTLFAALVIALMIPAAAFAECVPGGCSGQLCLDDAKDGNGVTTCEWAEVYGCYELYGQCAAQADGACGWTKTPELDACLKDPSIATKELEKRNASPQ